MADKVLPKIIRRSQLQTEGYKAIKGVIETDRPAVIEHSNGEPLVVVLNWVDFRLMYSEFASVGIKLLDREGREIDFDCWRKDD